MNLVERSPLVGIIITVGTDLLHHVMDHHLICSRLFLLQDTMNLDHLPIIENASNGRSLLLEVEVESQRSLIHQVCMQTNPCFVNFYGRRPILTKRNKNTMNIEEVIV